MRIILIKSFLLQVFSNGHTNNCPSTACGEGNEGGVACTKLAQQSGISPPGWFCAVPDEITLMRKPDHARQMPPYAIEATEVFEITEYTGKHQLHLFQKETV